MGDETAINFRNDWSSVIRNIRCVGREEAVQVNLVVALGGEFDDAIAVTLNRLASFRQSIP